MTNAFMVYFRMAKLHVLTSFITGELNINFKVGFSDILRTSTRWF